MQEGYAQYDADIIRGRRVRSFRILSLQKTTGNAGPTKANDKSLERRDKFKERIQARDVSRIGGMTKSSSSSSSSISMSIPFEVGRAGGADLILGISGLE